MKEWRKIFSKATMDFYQKKSRQRHSCIKEKYVSKVMIYLLHLTSRFWQKIPKEWHTFWMFYNSKQKCCFQKSIRKLIKVISDMIRQNISNSFRSFMNIHWKNGSNLKRSTSWKVAICLGSWLDLNETTPNFQVLVAILNAGIKIIIFNINF